MQNDFYKLVMPDSVQSYLKDIEKNAKMAAKNSENNLEFIQKAELAKLRSKHAEELALLKQQYARLQNTTTTQAEELQLQKHAIRQLTVDNAKISTQYKTFVAELEALTDEYIFIKNMPKPLNNSNFASTFTFIGRYVYEIDSSEVSVFSEKLLTLLNK